MEQVRKRRVGPGLRPPARYSEPGKRGHYLLVLLRYGISLSPRHRQSREMLRFAESNLVRRPVSYDIVAMMLAMACWYPASSEAFGVVPSRMQRYQFTQWSGCSIGSTLFSPRIEPSRWMPPSAVSVASSQPSLRVPLSPQ